jgi:NAD(P)-dependent dehydrogenase (short-subunit alcohol dehydrogenase family)
MSNELNFDGKVALVTGASRGIGAAIAQALSSRGARCVLNDLSAPNDAAAKCSGSKAIAADVSSFDAVAAMAAQIKAEFGGLDIIVNNAGILREKSIKKIELADFESTLKINLGGPFNVLRACGDLLREGASVVNMASVAGTLGFFGQSAYAPSKAGVIALTKVAAREFARQKVRVNAIAPGVIATEMTAGMKEEVTAGFIAQTPLGRLGTTEDIVGVALFLLSPLASYVTGQVIHVNGGFYMGGA